MKKLSLTIIVASILAGCASTSDIDNLQSQVNDVAISLEKVSTDIKSANALSSEAASKATKAEDANKLAAELSKTASGKLNRLFTVIMRK